MSFMLRLLMLLMLSLILISLVGLLSVMPVPFLSENRYSANKMRSPNLLVF
jgi:hypothetical protein